MDCRCAKQQIALWIGQDLDEEAEQKVRRHVERCRPCQDYRRQLQHSLEALHELAPELHGAVERSVWPRVARGLAEHEEAYRLQHFNGWLPGMAVIAACLLMFVYAGGQPRATQQWHKGVPSVWDSGNVTTAVGPPQRQQPWDANPRVRPETGPQKDFGSIRVPPPRDPDTKLDGPDY